MSHLVRLGAGKPAGLRCARARGDAINLLSATTLSRREKHARTIPPQFRTLRTTIWRNRALFWRKYPRLRARDVLPVEAMKIRFLLALLTLTVTTAGAQQTLFEDTFGQLLPRSVESRGDFHVGKETRQNGPLAPVEYTHNGEGWQAQTHFFPQDGVICRLFPVRPWLLASPGWELDQADGTYEVVFEFSHPDSASHFLAQDDTGRPPASNAETVLVVGEALPGGETDKLPARGIAVVVRTSPDLPSFLRVDGKPAGEFAANSNAPSPRMVKIRWKQEGGVVSDIEAELDGEKIQADGGFAFAGPKVLFGGRGRFAPPDYEPGKINCLNVLRLAYRKE